MTFMKSSSLTVIIPAYNEEPTLATVVHKVVFIAEKHLSDYEIIIVDDASTDRTGDITDQLAAQNNKIVPIHNPRNMNLGYNIGKGIDLARMEYFCMFPADDDVTEATFERLVQAIGSADLILAYHSNYEARHPLRRIVSKLFTGLMNVLFGLRVRYYNGPAVIRTKLLRTVSVKTFGMAFMAEIVVTLIKRGHTYTEVPMTIKPERKGVNWRVFRLRNTWGVIKTIASLWWRVQVQKTI